MSREADNCNCNCGQEGGKDLIQYPSAENDFHLHSMVPISQFFQLLITVSDVVEFDEILCEVNWPKINQFFCYKPCEIPTVSLDHIYFFRF